jgi:thiamine biosynthesis protein ThiS
VVPVRKHDGEHSLEKIVVTLNGLREEVPAGLTVSALIAHFKEGDPDLIVEINGKYIYPREFNDVLVVNNDSIEFINPNLGG